MTPRAVVYSKTFHNQLLDHLDRGEQRYGLHLAAEKRQILLDLIETTLARTPAIKRRHSKLGLVVYPVSRTPFIVIYDYDDREIQVMTCFLQGAGDRIEDFDPSTVEW